MSLDDEDTPPNAETTKVYEAVSEAPNNYEVLGDEDSLELPPLPLSTNSSLIGVLSTV